MGEEIIIGILGAILVTIALYCASRWRSNNRAQHDKAAQLDALFQNATEGILFVNKKREIVLVNPFLEKMFGYSSSELVGKDMQILLPEKYSISHALYFQNFKDKPQTREKAKELWAKRKNGQQFPVEISLSYFHQGEHLIIIAFIQDITRQQTQRELSEAYLKKIKDQNLQLEEKVKQRTAELEKANIELQLSQQGLLKAVEQEKLLNILKSRFVTMASHEFRTPLSTILSSTFLLETYSGTQLESEAKKLTARIKRSVQGLTEVLNDFLNLGKLEEGKITTTITTFSVKALIADLTQELSLIMKEGQRFDVHYLPPHDALSSDQQMLRNILINLISNAIKYSPANSVITINVQADETTTIIEITDQGIGIPQQEQDQIFKRFFRAANATDIQGTGLGLNLARQYANLLSASITFRSILHEGSTFSVHIPIHSVNNPRTITVNGHEANHPVN